MPRAARRHAFTGIDDDEPGLGERQGGGFDHEILGHAGKQQVLADCVNPPASPCHRRRTSALIAVGFLDRVGAIDTLKRGSQWLA